MSYIHHSTRRAMKQKRKAGFSIESIARDHECRIETVKQVLNGTYNEPDPAPAKPRKKKVTGWLSPEQQAVAELRQDGFKDAAIAMVFGWEAVTTTPNFG